MAILFSDDFNRADGVPGANYVESGGGTFYQIVSNELNCSGNTRSLAIATGVLANRTDSKVTWRRASGAGYDAGVHLRSNFTGAQAATGSGYVLDFFGTQVDVIRRVNGVDTTVGSKTSLTLADNDLYAVEISGTGATVSFVLYLNGVSLGAAITDVSGSRLTAAGEIGIFVWASNSKTDDLQVEDLGSAPITIIGQINKPGPGVSPDYLQMFRGRQFGHRVADTSITGTLTNTLDDLTLAAAGNLPIAGTLTKTLDNVTLASAGNLPIAGSLSKTLDNVTLSAAGNLPIKGDLAKTLDDLTLESTGAASTDITGTASITLADLTLSSAGNLPIVGTLTKTLDNVTLSSFGSKPIDGTLSVTLDDVVLSAAGHGPILDTEDTIDGEPSYTINVAYGSVMIYHRGDRRFFTL